MKRLRIYVDTSVIGGCLDPEFADESKALVEMARRGEATLLVSDLLLEELARAPLAVQQLLGSLPADATEFVAASSESLALSKAYLAAGVVGASSDADAHHVALATVAQADMIVSWNFKHIVHFDKIRGYNGINLVHGYREIEIHSPPEVVP